MSDESNPEERRRLLTNTDRNRGGDEERKYPTPVPSNIAATASASSSAPATAASSSYQHLPPAAALPASVPIAGPVYRLTLLKNNDQSIIVDAAPDWTLERLRSYAYPPEIINAPSKSIVIVYMGRRFPPSALQRTLAELHIRPHTSVHFLLHDRSQRRPSSFQNDAQAEGEDMMVPDAQYEGYWMMDEREREGTMCEFVVGSIMGVLLGIIALIWLLQPSVSRLCRLGICFGISLNLMLGLSRWFLLTPGFSSDGIHGPQGAREPSHVGFDPPDREPVLIGPTKHD